MKLNRKAVLTASFVVSLPVYPVGWAISYGLLRAEARRHRKQGRRQLKGDDPKFDAMLALAWPVWVLAVIPTETPPLEKT